MMSTRPVNEEQLMAELAAVSNAVPHWAIQFTPSEWFVMVNALELATHVNCIEEEAKPVLRHLADAIARAFPAEFQEIHRAMKRHRTNETYGTDEGGS